MLDSFDLKILKEWQKAGDTGPGEMSKLVHLSPSQCSRRMSALKASGLIRSVNVVLDAERLGLGVTAYLLVSLKTHNPKATESFYARLNELDEVLECQTLTGAADAILKVRTKDLKTFNDLLTNELLSFDAVANVQSSIVLENIKSTTVVPTRFIARDGG